MKTQEQVTQEINTFSAMINGWANDSGNRQAYISRAGYLTAGTERQSYNMALSNLKKEVKIEIAENIASAEIKVALVKIYAKDHTKKDLVLMAKEKGIKVSGTKEQITTRLNA